MVAMVLKRLFRFAFAPVRLHDTACRYAQGERTRNKLLGADGGSKRQAFSRMFICCFLTLLFVDCAANKFADLKDPFVMPQPPSTTSAAKIRQPITLEGIVYSGQKRSAAILAHGDKREVVDRGARFEGHQLVVIGKNFVVLQRGKQRKKLLVE